MSRTKTPLEAALEYAAEGIAVFPLHTAAPDGSCSCGDEGCRQAGKHPRTREGHRAATTDEEQVRAWWAKGRWPRANIGACSPDFVCLDVDVKNGGEGPRSLERLVADNAPLPDTPVAMTGRWVDPETGEAHRGRHYWFRVPEGMAVTSRVGVRPGVDLKCSNGYAVLPPSTHSSGVSYEWLLSPDDAPYAEAPPWLADLLPARLDPADRWKPDPAFRASREVRDFLRGSYEPDAGEQRVFLVRAARSVLTTGASILEAATILWEGYDGDGGAQAMTVADESWPWTEEDVYLVVDSTFRTQPTSAMEKDFSEDGSGAGDGDFLNTDWGNAHRLISSIGEDEVFHVSEWGKWYLWDGARWHEDDGATLRTRVEGVSSEMFEEAARIANRGREDDAKALMRWGHTTQSRPRTEAAVALARDLVRRSHDELNRDPFLLNCTNGVVDLSSGELLEHDPTMLLTKQARCDYVAGARSTLWDRVLETWVPSREMRDFLQRVFGYALTGVTDEHKFFYFYGPPRSGKSTLLEAFLKLVGNYGEAAEPDTFMLRRAQGGPTEDLARLSACRVVVTHEIEEGMRFAEAKISHLTGGDSVTARFLHQQSFTFVPKFKLFFTANHMPRVSGSAQSGLWRRLIVVDFDRAIPEDQCDPMLPRRLQATEAQRAMLAWCVEGARLWWEDYDAGKALVVPQQVKQSVEDYRLESDDVAQFVATIARTDDRWARVESRAFYEYYLGWCDSVGRKHPYTSAKLTRRLKDLGYVKKFAQVSAGEDRMADCWIGVKLPGGRRERGDDYT